MLSQTSAAAAVQRKRRRTMTAAAAAAAWRKKLRAKRGRQIRCPSCPGVSTAVSTLFETFAGWAKGGPTWSCRCATRRAATPSRCPRTRWCPANGCASSSPTWRPCRRRSTGRAVGLPPRREPRERPETRARSLFTYSVLCGGRARSGLHRLVSTACITLCQQVHYRTNVIRITVQTGDGATPERDGYAGLVHPHVLWARRAGVDRAEAHAKGAHALCFARPHTQQPHADSVRRTPATRRIGATCRRASAARSTEGGASRCELGWCGAALRRIGPARGESGARRT